MNIDTIKIYNIYQLVMSHYELNRVMQAGQ